MSSPKMPDGGACSDEDEVEEGGGGGVGGGGGGGSKMENEDQVVEIEGMEEEREKQQQQKNGNGKGGDFAAQKTAGVGGLSLGESGGGGGMGGFWRQSRPSSPRMPPPEQREQRPKSRHDPALARYNNLGYWRARRVTFYKNGDPYFPGVEFRFKPRRDIGSLEALLDRLSLRLDLPRGARYIFSMDGDRKINLDELEDGASYVVSSYKTFKVSKVSKKENTCFTILRSKLTRMLILIVLGVVL
ncbi:echinoderm microtubule-associated protein-like CG42247 [Polistes fuscatus]|uniref:echinoderm microtubule-associated protein-like CG42247 n=1 Tax=Polistes fuscatus TaxID=30207 RepID=UPI001CA8CDDD|nr:echinoderm microtubule-associated protein-like CG42247 [Polistes fuscatus]